MTNISWLPGPPPGRGLYWIVWRGTVVPVGIEPALLHLNDPTARLLIKTLGGLAYPLGLEAGHITYHAPLVAPEKP